MDVYELTDGFGVEVWRKFARIKLGLDNKTIQDVEDKYEGQSIEQRIQMYDIWVDKGGDRDKFLLKKHEFFCTGYSSPGNVVYMATPDGALYEPGNAINNSSRTKVEPHEESHDDELQPYKLTGAGGCALIITNSFEEGGCLTSRKKASKKDGKMMRDLWKDTLGCNLFENTVHEDVSAQGIIDVCRRLSKVENCDYVVVVIGTHGGAVPQNWLEEYGPKSQQSLSNLAKLGFDKVQGELDSEDLHEVLIGSDERLVRLQKLKEFFSNDEAVGLRDKPKLFILEYCRGHIASGGVFVGLNAVAADTGPFDTEKKQGKTTIFPLLMPETSDIVFAYPTQEYRQAYHSDQGSMHIKAVFDVFQKYCKTRDVVDMLTIVNGRTKRSAGVTEQRRVVKPMSIFESTLERKFFFVSKEQEVSRVRIDSILEEE